MFEEYVRNVQSDLPNVMCGGGGRCRVESLAWRKSSCKVLADGPRRVRRQSLRHEAKQTSLCRDRTEERATQWKLSYDEHKQISLNKSQLMCHTHTQSERVCGVWVCEWVNSIILYWKISGVTRKKTSRWQWSGRAEVIETPLRSDNSKPRVLPLTLHSVHSQSFHRIHALHSIEILMSDSTAARHNTIQQSTPSSFCRLRTKVRGTNILLTDKLESKRQFLI